MTQPPEGMIPAATPNPPPPSVDPRQAVQTPAIMLLVAAGIGAAACIVMLLLNILDTGIGAMSSESGEDQALNLLSGGIGIMFNIIGLGVAGFIIYGALQMKDLKNHNLALFAAIASMVPCISPCCFVGLPAGIWALVVLNKPEVKAAFAKK